MAKKESAAVAEVPQEEEGQELSFELDPSEVPDAVLLAEGEYDLTVQKAEVRVAKTSGNKYFNLQLVYMDNPAVDPIYYSLFPPKPDDDERKKLVKQRMIKKFLEAAGVDLSTGQYKISDTENAVIRFRVKQTTTEEGLLRNEIAGIV